MGIFMKAAYLLIGGNLGDRLAYLKSACEKIQQKGIKIHLVSFKDFYNNCANELKQYRFKKIYEFNTQPNMIFNLDKNSIGFKSL